MTASSRRLFNTDLLDKIMTPRSKNYEAYLSPFGDLIIDCDGKFTLYGTDIDRIQKEYNCKLSYIDCEDQTCISIAFERNDAKFRLIKFEYQHTAYFDVCYEVRKRGSYVLLVIDG